MKLRTLHKRKHRKLFGREFPRKHLRDLVLCNKMAASSDAYDVKFSSGYDFGAGYDNLFQSAAAIRKGERINYYFKGVFYALKDAVMDAYGKPKGFTLQHWTSYAEDYGGDYGVKDGCSHEHILERVRLAGRIFHRPTNHFEFYNSVSDYYKKTVGFSDMKKLCVETIEGKKRERKLRVPTKDAARAALKRLVRRYGRLLPVENVRERPRVITGNYMWDAFERRATGERETLQARESVQCHYCLKTFTGAEVSRMNGHDFCAPCKAKAYELEPIPF